jgi:hypothetical protein
MSEPISDGRQRRHDIFMRGARINRKIDDGTATDEDMAELSALALELRMVDVLECAKCAAVDRAMVVQVVTTMLTEPDAPNASIQQVIDGYLIRFHRRAHLRPGEW